MRQYLVGSWNNADSYDYSGEMLLGSRHKGRSICADHVLPDGKANLARYADVEQPKKTKKLVPIAHQIIPQQKTLDKLDTQELALHKTYKNEEVSLEEYEELLYALNQKRERAFKSLNKALGRQETNDDGDPVGQDGLEEKTSKRGLYSCNKLMFNSNSLSSVDSVIKNDWKSDVKLFLTGSVMLFTLITILINI